MRKIKLDNPLILTGLTGHFKNDSYMLVEEIHLRESGKTIKYYGKSFQIMSDGQAEFRGEGYYNGKISITGFTKN